jgi:hypothetical protein
MNLKEIQEQGNELIKEYGVVRGYGQNFINTSNLALLYAIKDTENTIATLEKLKSHVVFAFEGIGYELILQINKQHQILNYLKSKYEH